MQTLSRSVPFADVLRAAHSFGFTVTKRADFTPSHLSAAFRLGCSKPLVCCCSADSTFYSASHAAAIRSMEADAAYRRGNAMHAARSYFHESPSYFAQWMANHVARPIEWHPDGEANGFATSTEGKDLRPAVAGALGNREVGRMIAEGVVYLGWLIVP